MPLTIKIPEVQTVELLDGDGNQVVVEEVHVLVDLLRKSQEGIDTKDQLQTAVWTGRFAAILNESYGISKPINSAQAYLIADAVNGYWSGIVKSFRQGPK